MGQQIMEKEHIIDIPNKKNFKIIMLSQSNQTFFKKDILPLFNLHRTLKKYKLICKNRNVCLGVGR